MLRPPSTRPQAAPSTPKSRRVGILSMSQETLQVAPGSWEPQRPRHNLAKTCATVNEDVLVETLRWGERAPRRPARLRSTRHLQTASHRPPASGLRAPRAAVRSRLLPVTGTGGGRDAAARARAGEGDPRSSSSGGRSPGKSPLSRRRRRRTKRRRKRRERRRGRKPP